MTPRTSSRSRSCARGAGSTHSNDGRRSAAGSTASPRTPVSPRSRVARMDASCRKTRDRRTLSRRSARQRATSRGSSHIQTRRSMESPMTRQVRRRDTRCVKRCSSRSSRPFRSCHRDSARRFSCATYWGYQLPRRARPSMRRSRRRTARCSARGRRSSGGHRIVARRCPCRTSDSAACSCAT